MSKRPSGWTSAFKSKIEDVFKLPSRPYVVVMCSHHQKFKDFYGWLVDLRAWRRRGNHARAAWAHQELAIRIHHDEAHDFVKHIRKKVVNATISSSVARVSFF